MVQKQKIQSDGPAPYTSALALIAVIDGYRSKGLQTPFTLGVLTKAGVAESLAPRTLQALEILGLVDESGHPTEEFVALRKASKDKFQDRFGSFIRSAYSEVFSYADPAVDDREQVRDAFRDYTPIGQQDRMVNLFLALCDYAGIVAEDTMRKRSSGTPGTQKPRLKRPRSSKSHKPSLPAAEYPSPKMPGTHPLIDGLFQELPPSGSEWSKQKSEDWLELARVTVPNDLRDHRRRAAQGFPNEWRGEGS